MSLHPIVLINYLFPMVRDNTNHKSGIFLSQRHKALQLFKL